MLMFRPRGLAPAFVAVVLFTTLLAAACGNSDNPTAALDSGAAPDAIATDADARADAPDASSGECGCGAKSGSRLRAIFATEASTDGARSRYFERSVAEPGRGVRAEVDPPPGEVGSILEERRDALPLRSLKRLRTAAGADATDRRQSPQRTTLVHQATFPV